MKKLLLMLSVAFLAVGCNTSDNIRLSGLKEDVEIVRDQWGINHIYAKNQADLFFAQGYAAARDRLFQFEIWRRQANGTVAEILGERELKRDIGTRLFKYRGDMEAEMSHYHEDGIEIITAFVDGVNAYIEEINKTPEDLPMEFKLLAIKPQPWTPKVVISRHQGLLGNIQRELKIGQAVAIAGEETVKDLYWFHPKEPLLALDSTINKGSLQNDILELYNAYRQPVRFEIEDIIPDYRVEELAENYIPQNDLDPDEATHIGSNNWVIRGNLMEDGQTYMANDPHRTLAIPSLRYMAHLVAPGWNVIGGGEPEIPGISIGHNDYGAWGLTVYFTDGEDLYVYDLNPDNLNQYMYQGEWENMSLTTEIIPVKDGDARMVEFRYTRHGPVTFIDSVNHKGYAVRCAWLEPGGSPYLASLRMDQASTWEEFREACNYSHIPGENMIWADREGNIGWQAVGIAPVRENFSGLVPVPGDGRYEWSGYLPIIEKPNTYNPDAGYFATANENITPETYDNWDAIGYFWSDPYRGERIKEVIESGKKLNLEDMKALQTDYLSIPARTLVPLLTRLDLGDERLNQALQRLENWDFGLESESVAATIYIGFEKTLREQAFDRFVPDNLKTVVNQPQLKTVIDWVLEPGPRFGANPEAARDDFLGQCFGLAIEELTNRLGEDMEEWQYGQENMKHVYLQHPMSSIIIENLKYQLDAGPAPRGGSGYTPGATSNNLNQSSGASFRIISNTGNWDETIGSNTPGQSGNPDSPYYKNLFNLWANDQYFPLYFSREKIDSVATERIHLVPREKE